MAINRDQWLNNRQQTASTQSKQPQAQKQRFFSIVQQCQKPLMEQKNRYLYKPSSY
jgi:hypothetical protein